jgi:hypothetical protein
LRKILQHVRSVDANRSITAEKAKPGLAADARQFLVQRNNY